MARSSPSKVGITLPGKALERTHTVEVKVQFPPKEVLSEGGCDREE